MPIQSSKLDIPPPPISCEGSFWLVYGEWVQITEQSVLATTNNPNPQGGAVMQPIGLNEVTDMHPAVWAVAAAGSRMHYQLKWAIEISQEVYEWYHNVQVMIQKHREALAQAAQNGGIQDGTSRLS